MIDSYEKTEWVNNETPLNASNMNKIEDRLSELDNAIEFDELVGENGINISDHKASGIVFSIRSVDVGEFPPPDNSERSGDFGRYCILTEPNSNLQYLYFCLGGDIWVKIPCERVN